MHHPRVADLMITGVQTVSPHDSVDTARDLLATHGIHALPVADETGILVGIVSTMDLLVGQDGATPLGDFMTERVFTVAQYDGPHIAARVMRNHRIHHVVVTHEQKIVGIISSFDLLRLVEEHRYITKNPPTPTGGDGGRQ